jgi:hypothetical protein
MEMRHNLIMSSKSVVAAAALLVAVSASALAAPVTINITSVTGVWSSGTTDAPGVPLGLGTSQISWGVPAPPNTLQSSYSFAGNAPQLGLGVGSVFTLGTFTHNNFPIFAPSLLTATLDVTIVGTAQNGGVVPINHVQSFNFTHNETTNGCSPLPGCANDIVTVANNFGGSQPINIDGTDYVFSFTGFLVGGNPFVQFSTVEEQSNSAFMQGSFIQLASVPGPVAGAGLPGLVLAFGGTLAWWRRRKHPA